MKNKRLRRRRKLWLLLCLLSFIVLLLGNILCVELLGGTTPVYSASELPEGATFDTETGEFSWTPEEGQAGVYSILFCASDGIDMDCELVTITVTKPEEGITSLTGDTIVELPERYDNIITALSVLLPSVCLATIAVFMLLAYESPIVAIVIGVIGITMFLAIIQAISGLLQ